MKTIAEVLTFWFGNRDTVLAPKEKSGRWFQPSAEFDQEIHQQFYTTYCDALEGHCAEWQSSADGTMALLVLLDQMSRNMFRGTEKAFASDDLALSACLAGIDKGFDKKLTLSERIFFYHPLEHSESLEIQTLSITKFTELLQDFDEEYTETIESCIYWAKEHYDIIEKFGRFPHRNAILNRESTSEEVDFLKTSTSFGQ